MAAVPNSFNRKAPSRIGKTSSLEFYLKFKFKFKFAGLGAASYLAF